MSLSQARETIETWRLDYNAVRPHSALGNVPPQEFEQLTLNRATAPILSSWWSKVREQGAITVTTRLRPSWRHSPNRVSGKPGTVQDRVVWRRCAVTLTLPIVMKYSRCRFRTGAQRCVAHGAPGLRVEQRLRVAANDRLSQFWPIIGCVIGMTARTRWQILPASIQTCATRERCARSAKPGQNPNSSGIYPNTQFVEV